MKNTYSEELDYASQIIKEAGYLYIKQPQAPADIYMKGEYDVVTSTDYAIESFIIDKLSKNFPGDKILSEESYTELLTDERTWVIDPLDGTNNYARKIPTYGIQIALLIKKQPVIAAIYLPELEEMYTAHVNNGSYLNGRKISVNSSVELNQAVISMGDFSKNGDRVEKNRIRLLGIAKIANRIAQLKMWGAACYDLASLAVGRTDAYLVYSYDLWDVMPGYLIAKEAGAIFAQLTGEPFDVSATTTIGASNPELMNALLKLLKL
ncbi:inositol monophosphatase [Planktothrix sp. FACHB-1355]|uniref:Inositol-1-monophosphatase n=1 Tax=Aerosakkonema funiforme FACHB-1375 TaxID=2949571 RepID=A0A926ZFY1_9CYAN|nr:MULTISPECIES: inositol monophosphatase family protein [Oscillatoriales]MBD2181340.1 inositol monophosphatase [Aerosakkonema funiforme FACHB-1375]MBD3557562.1 inositol monophosphatase [Planktothrix sp. FACHB-1355]